MKRITLSTSKPATKLRQFAAKLNRDDWEDLMWQLIVERKRLIVFNVAANGAVTLAEQPETELVAA